MSMKELIAKRKIIFTTLNDHNAIKILQNEEEQN